MFGVQSVYADNLVVDGLVLKYQINSALCQTHKNKNTLKQCKNGMIVSIIGLQPLSNNKINAKGSQKELVIAKKHANQIGTIKCTSSMQALPPLQAKVISRWMPEKNLRQLSWQMYGACAGLSSQKYFRMIDKFTSQLNIPERILNGKRSTVSKNKLVSEFMNKNPGMKQQAISFVCKTNNKLNSSVLSELQVCYDTQGKYSSCKTTKPYCPSKFTILQF